MKPSTCDWAAKALQCIRMVVIFNWMIRGARCLEVALHHTEGLQSCITNDSDGMLSIRRTLQCYSTSPTVNTSRIEGQQGRNRIECE